MENRTRIVVKVDTPIEGTHLTEAALTEMWYAQLDEVNPYGLHRKNGILFPRSRKDLIQYFTEQSLWEQGK